MIIVIVRYEYSDFGGYSQDIKWLLPIRLFYFPKRIDAKGPTNFLN
jgi:hypothetical protein